MSHVPHELAEEFPAEAELLQTLRRTNAHAARLMDEYHEANRAVHRAETDVAPVSDAEMQRLRKARMVLKDEIARLLRAPAASE